MTDVNAVQTSKAPSPILLILVGIEIDVSAIQTAKALSPIEVKWFGMVSSPVGHVNHAAYVVTEEGMIDDANPVLPNANAHIDLTLVGIVIATNDVHDMKAP